MSILPNHPSDINDSVYYNIRISNDSPTERKQAIFSVTRVEPILYKPSDYVLSVERFRVPTTNIPIMVWDSDKIGRYQVLMRFGGTEVSVNLEYIANTSNPADDLYGPSIWSYQDFLDMLNQALSQAFTLIKASHPTAPPTEAPFITFDATTTLYTFNAEQTYDSSLTTIEVLFNSSLYELFNGFRSFNEVPYERIVIRNTYNNLATINGKPYFSIVSEFSTVGAMADLISFQFLTNSIPVTTELQSSQNNITQQVITDFEVSSSEISDLTPVYFFLQGPRRLYDLNSDYPMKMIDLNVRWVSRIRSSDRTQKTYPVYVHFVDAPLTVKIRFKRKDMVYEDMA